MQHVGIDFSSGVELAQHTEALADPGAGAGAARTDSPDDVEAGLPSFTDTAFFLYYDEVAEKYDMRDPLVVAPDGSEVECAKPSALERGVRYFCVVTLKDGGYAAEVLPESGAEGKDPEDYDAIWKVHLFNVPKEGEEDYGEEEPGHEDGMQYHTGAVVVGGGGGGSVVPDDVSTEFIPDPPQGQQPTGDEGKLQIKGFKSGQPADTNTIAAYLKGTAQITGQVWLIVRGQSTGGDPMLGYLPLSAIWGDGSSGGLPRPEVTYLDDVTWDPSNHQLIKHWVTKNIVTGAETPVQGAPQGKTATISTTPISSIIGS